MPLRSAPPEIETAPAPGASLPGRGGEALRSSRNTVIVIVPILLVLITFLFWYQTWFGRALSDREMAQVLADTSVPHKTQHAVAQLSDRIAQGDPTVKRWYPQLLALAQNKESQLRLEAAWAMGQDNQSEEFHQALRKLTDDPVPLVRWNAALALVRFGDAMGEPQIRSMLQPFTLGAPVPGAIRFRMKEQDDVRNGSIIARIRLRESDPQRDVLSPLGGTITRLLTKDGATVAAGEAVAVIAPDEGQVVESLRALYLVGQPQDLGDVERFVRGAPHMSERVRQQAEATAGAIRQRSAKGKN
ncbi:MAG: HEAT repeat domain-containing protein [Terriglobia bacterium]